MQPSKPEELPKVALLLGIGEARWARDLAKDREFEESLIVLLGKGDREVGLRELDAVRQRQVQDYLACLQTIGIDKTGRLHPLFASWAEGSPAS